MDYRLSKTVNIWGIIIRVQEMGYEWHLDGTWEIQPMVYIRFSGIHHPGELHESIQAITAITTISIDISHTRKTRAMNNT